MPKSPRQIHVYVRLFAWFIFFAAVVAPALIIWKHFDTAVVIYEVLTDRPKEYSLDGMPVDTARRLLRAYCEEYHDPDGKWNMRFTAYIVSPYTYQVVDAKVENGIIVKYRYRYHN